jgi:hypothetical protein
MFCGNSFEFLVERLIIEGSNIYYGVRVVPPANKMLRVVLHTAPTHLLSPIRGRGPMSIKSLENRPSRQL